MRIAVINETSAADRNADILAALDGFGHTVINAGMTRSGAQPELTYIHTGFMAALLLNLQRVDFVIGGCGTGQGFLNAVMQYPGVVCGHILNSLDAWLFRQINDGNCISLMLNQGYGWAGNVNLKFIFEKLFCSEGGAGYPPGRAKSQKQSRQILEQVNRAAHRPLAEIIRQLPEEVLRPALTFPGVPELLNLDEIADTALRAALLERLKMF